MADIQNHWLVPCRRSFCCEPIRMPREKTFTNLKHRHNLNYPVNTKHWNSVDLILGQCLRCCIRRWPKINQHWFNVLLLLGNSQPCVCLQVWFSEVEIKHPYTSNWYSRIPVLWYDAFSLSPWIGRLVQISPPWSYISHCNRSSFLGESFF